jgi:hypothetical protein
VFRVLASHPVPLLTKQMSRLFLLFLIALVSTATAQLGAGAQLGALGPQTTTGAQAAAPWEQRKQDDSKWGTSFDSWKKARDALNANPTDATAQSNFNKAGDQFYQSSLGHRQSTTRWDQMSAKQMCPSDAADRRHGAESRQRNSDDNKHAQDNEAWGKAYSDMTSARDAMGKDPRNADKKKRFDDANKRFMDASSRHSSNNEGWKKKSQGHQQESRSWEQDKGFSVAPPAISLTGPNLRAV